MRNPKLAHILVTYSSVDPQNTAVTAQHERILVLEQHSKDLERTVYDVKHLVKELINSQSQVNVSCYGPHWVIAQHG